MRRTHIIATLVSLLFAQPVLGQGALPVKQVTAPPGDIVSGVVKLPDPIELGESSRTLLLPIDPERADADGVIDLGFPFVLGDGRARIVFLPEQPGAWVGVVDAMSRRSGQQMEVRTDAPSEQAGVSIVRDPLPWGDPARVFDAITLPQDRSAMSVSIELAQRVGGFILIDQAPDRSLYTYVKQRRTLVDRPITLAGSLSDGSKIVTLRAIVRAPDGSAQTIGAGVDSSELSFTPSAPGKYSVQVFAEYANKNNLPVLLSTQHLIEVERAAMPLGEARVSVSDDRIEIAFDDAASNDRVILAAEVWGKSGGRSVPVCWVSRVCDAGRSLSFDPRWIALAGADPSSLELRQVRVHDVDSLVPVLIDDRVALRAPALDPPEAPSGVTADMLVAPSPVMVRAPDGVDPSSRGTLPGGHRLLLVHGYCSDGNPFPTAQFSGDIAVFHDPNVSRSNDAFALQIMAQGAPMKSFGVASHSQGAMAALHLYTFYFSGLDWARGDRLIQSVGAPYQGTPLAGNAAVLGDIFGVGCGENSDMTYSGAASWLSLIPTGSRQQVWYYTTSFEDRPFLYDYCNIITDLLLSDPDDGVIEQSRGQLPGATNMGHTEGWCHTMGMRDPAQCTDASRNSVINARAKR